MAPVVRSSARPWQYELQYHLLLFQTGLVGVACYSAGILWMIGKAYKISAADPGPGAFLIPTIAGLAGVLIGNASNPYLQAYGALWMVFLPLAIINHWCLHVRGPKRPSGCIMARESPLIVS